MEDAVQGFARFLAGWWRMQYRGLLGSKQTGGGCSTGVCEVPGKLVEDAVQGFARFLAGWWRMQYKGLLGSWQAGGGCRNIVGSCY